MKYYLIVGYHLTEKHKDYPTVRISVNNKLVTEFVCDNEELSETKFRRSGTTKIVASKDNAFYDTNTETREQLWKIPKKCKIIELDSSEWGTGCDLVIQGLNNRSNYTNGFMTKESLISFLPVYLVPKPILDDPNLLDRIVTKTFGFTKFRVYTHDDRPTFKNVNILKGRYRWPGIFEAFPQFFGGEFTKRLQIRKKLNFYFIHDPDDKERESIGFPLVKNFSYAFLSHLQKIRRDVEFTGEVKLRLDGRIKNNPSLKYDIKLQKNKYSK